MEAAALQKGYPYSKHQTGRTFKLNRSSDQKIIISGNCVNNSVKFKKLRLRTCAVAEVSSDFAPQVEITWQIVVGALGMVYIICSIHPSKDPSFFLFVCFFLMNLEMIGGNFHVCCL